MKIEHVAMYVSDIEEAKDFFIKYFGADSNDMYHNIKTDFTSYFLSFDDGARLEIMNRPSLTDEEDKLMRMGYNHVAISTGSKESVDKITEVLIKDGYEHISGPRVTGDGYYESCFAILGGCQLEITI